MAKKLYIFVIFQKGGSAPPAPLLDQHMNIQVFGCQVAINSSSKFELCFSVFLVYSFSNNIFFYFTICEIF